MHKTIIENATGLVVNVIELDDDSEWAPDEGYAIGPDGGNIGDTLIEGVYKRPDPTPEPPPTIGDYKLAIQAHIDAVARAKDYDSGISLAGYKGSPVPAYAADAEAFTNWRDPLWPFLFETLAAVQTGQIEQPTIAELIAMLPQPPWPV